MPVAVAVTCSAGALLVWLVTSWSVASLQREWSYCRPAGLSSRPTPAKTSQGKWLESALSSVISTLIPWFAEEDAINTQIRTVGTGPFRPDLTPQKPGSDLPKITKQQLDRLNEQSLMLAFLEWRNCKVAAYFLNRQLSTFSMATVTGLAALASLFLVSKKGWEQTDSRIIYVGVCCGMITVGAVSYSTLFGYIGSNPNVNLFITAYKRDAWLGHALRSAASTGIFPLGDLTIASATSGQENAAPAPTLNLGAADDASKLIQLLDREIAKTTIVDLSFDSSFVQETGQKLMELGKPNP
jgi:hypothetical protein